MAKPPHKGTTLAQVTRKLGIVARAHEATKERLYKALDANAVLARDRNAVLMALGRLYEAHLMPITRPHEGWTYALCIHLPAGPVTWHIPDAEVSQFNGLTVLSENHWDGCKAVEKDARLAALTPTTA